MRKYKEKLNKVCFNQFRNSKIAKNVTQFLLFVERYVRISPELNFFKDVTMIFFVL